MKIILVSSIFGSILTVHANLRSSNRRRSTSSLITLFFSIYPIFSNIRIFFFAIELSPNDIGTIHTDAFEELGNKYRSSKPASFDEVIQDVSLISSSYCPEGDEVCTSTVLEKAVQESKKSHFGFDIEYPESFDVQVKDVLDEVLLEVELLSSQNAEEIIDHLSAHKNRIENMDDVDEASQIVGVATVSVGIESAKLWDTAINDREHSLHDMIGYFNPSKTGLSNPNGNRLLQETDDNPILYYGWIAVSDMGAALEGGFDVLETVMADPTALVDILICAVMGSASAAFSDGGYYNDDYFRYYEYENEVQIGGNVDEVQNGKEKVAKGGKDKGGKNNDGEKDKGAKGGKDKRARQR